MHVCIPCTDQRDCFTQVFLARALVQLQLGFDRVYSSNWSSLNEVTCSYTLSLLVMAVKVQNPMGNEHMVLTMDVFC